MSWSEHEGFLKKLAKKGRSSKALSNKPYLHDDLIDVWQAFQDLSRTRTIGMLANPIQASEIEAWLRMHGITSIEEQSEYYQMIIALDAAWFKWCDEKEKSITKRKGKP